MNYKKLEIPDVIMFEPKVFEDARGYFFESFNYHKFSEIVGYQVNFVQDNQSFSKKNVLRGMHYQIGRPQSKLVRVTEGEVFDVAVDLRRESPTFGKWVGAILSAKNNLQLWIPEGFAHGFLVLSEVAVFQYKVTDYWYKDGDRCLRFDDETMAIEWPVVNGERLIVSDKDANGMKLSEADLF